MAIKNNHPTNASAEYLRWMRKGDQESEMASMAAADGDQADAIRRFAKAKEYWQKAAECHTGT